MAAEFPYHAYRIVPIDRFVAIDITLMFGACGNPKDVPFNLERLGIRKPIVNSLPTVKTQVYGRENLYLGHGCLLPH